LEQVIEPLLDEMGKPRYLVRARQEVVVVFQENVEAMVDTTMSAGQDVVETI
jgi:hypothetical protein